MRKEIYDPVVLDNFGCSSNIAGSQVRGYASKYVSGRVWSSARNRG